MSPNHLPQKQKISHTPCPREKNFDKQIITPPNNTGPKQTENKRVQNESTKIEEIGENKDQRRAVIVLGNPILHKGPGDVPFGSIFGLEN